ncbi:amino acid ABC transporter permease [Neorhizobium sp. NCHU2750]|uniref:amino acid ABC transporter permease n=1 Tax=Neorhizobium sp. NCHU2750 TaxID=1825976 RepID=UPI000E756AFA|nr:amino acid ABC transporter permease [Neorhizobium sp. NCHU2750]
MNIDLAARVAVAFADGVSVTIKVTIGSLALALSLALLLSALRYLRPGLCVTVIVSTYVELLRNVPSLTILFLCYFGLAALGIRLAPTVAAILGLGLVGAAICIDILTNGFHSVLRGQAEAAAALGLSKVQAFVLIILPQALRLSLAPLGNYAVSLVKDTSLVAAIAAPEVMFQARQIVNETFAAPFVYLSAAVVYLVLTLSLGQLIVLIERRLAYP